jgi:hypothetical protein
MSVRARTSTHDSTHAHIGLHEVELLAASTEISPPFGPALRACISQVPRCCSQVPAKVSSDRAPGQPQPRNRDTTLVSSFSRRSCGRRGSSRIDASNT